MRDKERRDLSTKIDNADRSTWRPFNGKVFGVGLGKTGTTSLARAMKLLGASVKHAPKNVDEIEAHDFTNDISVAWRFRFLDHVYPNAKFILTVRDTESWLKSYAQHARCASVKVPLRRLENRFMCFGRVDFNEDVFRRRFEAHNLHVSRHFSSSTGRLLILNVCAGEGWEKLCPFLDVPQPMVPFPCANQTRKLRSVNQQR